MFQKVTETSSESESRKISGHAKFGNDLDFLSEYTSIIYLSDEDKMAGLIVCPELQGRIMTSTAEGMEGPSFGWINYNLIASQKLMPQINPFGGEDRFWLGPEGGQFSVFFKEGVPFDLDHVFTPPPLDSQSFEVKGKTADQVHLTKNICLENYSGSQFNLKVDRVIRLISKEAAWGYLSICPLAGLKIVAFQSENTITNTGLKSWEKASGLLSVWILGMFKASAGTTVVIPLRASENVEKYLNDAYFGKVPGDRLMVKGNTLFFKGDGHFRSKIGVSLKGAKPILGSYDAIHEVLTIVQFTLLPEAEDYVNSMWEIQVNPFNGDVVNSYNDGPSEPGAKQLGEFYELETSSQAAALNPEESLLHIHRTFHLYGEKEELNKMALKILGVSLEEIKTALI